MKKPVVLIVLDGWGIAPPGPGNAVSLARLKHFPEYKKIYPHTELVASGEGVGLPSGEDGNTETGHINLGAGRIVYQDLPRINMSIADGSFEKNEAFVGAFKHAQTQGTNVHIMGLLSDGMVHSSRNHLYALLEAAKNFEKHDNVYLHVFTDGRDSPTNSGIRFLRELQEKINEFSVGRIATIMGRYYAMDRDRRWDRTEKAYDALTSMIPHQAKTPEEAIQRAYDKGITDEFIEPVIILDEHGAPYPRISENDAVIFFNFRIDRPRQLTKAFVLPDFETHSSHTFDPYTVKYYHKHIIEEDSRLKPFTRKIVIKELFFVTMTEYERNLPVIVAYPPLVFKSPLGRVLSDYGLRQLRIAETEKERFVTYYFNGMREDPFPGEDRLIVPSAKVATYDLKPEMSAYEITEKLLDRLDLDVYSFILVNFANADMVGHTGNIPAAVKACEVLDECLSKIVPAVLAHNGTCIITADHGNVEEMLGPDGEMDTEHSTYPVPCIIINKKFEGRSIHLPPGKLGDIAPTILHLMNIPIPSVMTGKNLLADVA
ncbi:MAG: 2,3-bisphosphoglycerate-independent phosphoglycerate mutase [Patescibacteria group bacterium]|nr:2,3-bisphosphoglycerate-independent phosphoglycerate mutase [Patescibacteria group bacterium]